MADKRVTICARLRRQPGYQTMSAQILETVAMLFDAHRDRDQLRVEAAMRQLEFIDSIARLSSVQQTYRRSR